jgi:hypothetical protein
VSWLPTNAKPVQSSGIKSARMLKYAFLDLALRHCWAEGEKIEVRDL